MGGVGLIRRIAALSVARPRTVLAIWIVFTAALAFIGRDVVKVLHDTDIVVPGTPSAAADQATRAQFGEATEIVVMLKGPAGELNRQGPVLVRRLDRLPDTDILSAWSPGSQKALRRTGETLLVLRTHAPLEPVVKHVLPATRKLVDETIAPPVTPHITGAAPIAEAMVKEGYGAAKRAERITAPIVLIVLLLVFRSPIAAALPAILGFAVIVSGRGVLTLVGSGVQLDTLALSLMSMLGMALGVDYSLLLVSRFREELARGRDPAGAASIAAGTAGRTVMFAGVVLIVAMLVASILAPGTMLVAASIGIVGATGLSVIGGLFALPAALVLVGHNVNRWRLGRGMRASSSATLANRVIRRPLLATALVLVPLLALVVPASGVQLGHPSVKNLSLDNRARKDFEAVSDAFGPGWASSFEILVASSDGPITDPKRLAALDRFQRDIAKSANVESVLGPGILAKSARQASEAAGDLENSNKRLARLDRGLDRAKGGSRQLEEGMKKAARGSAKLAEGAADGAGGADRVDGGAAELAAGIEKSADGSARLAKALGKLDAGARKVARGAGDAKRGADDLARPASRLARGLKEGQDDMAGLRDAARDAEAELAAALAGLDRMSVAAKTDPDYRTAYEHVATALGTLSGKDPITGQPLRSRYRGMAAALDGAIAETAEASRGATRLAKGAARLRGGLVDLRQGAIKLRRGAARVEAGGIELNGGMGRLRPGSQELTAGTRELDAGMARLDGAALALQEGLANGAPRTEELTGGLQRMDAGVESMGSRSSTGGASTADQARALDSGYFVMAGIDGSSAREQEAAGFAVNVDRGGTAARIMIVPAPHVKIAETDPLTPELEQAAARLESDLGVDAEIGGRAAIMRDYTTQASRNRVPLIAVLLAITFVLLVVVFRSLLMAFKAVILNLLTVAAAFGVLKLVFQGSSPLMGGPGYIEIITFYGIYAIVFAISMDYEVFLITRMREGYFASGTTEGAVSYGIERTAGIITGAAAIMAAVFVAFAVSGFGGLAQFGIGLTVAVLVDATVIRLVLLPASMRLFGRANWWLPKWLDRLLPKLEVEGDAKVKRVAPRPRLEGAS